MFSDELTRPQQQALLTEYERLYADLIERFAVDASPYRGPAPQLENDDPEAILRRVLG